MNRLGFTGTQIGMTQAQRVTLALCFATLEPLSFAHGDCHGSDEQAHEMARTARIPVHVYPPNIYAKRAWVDDVAYMHIELPYLERNRLIVDACDILIATPKRAVEELRSGTWSTVRYARRQRGGNRKQVIVILPNGATI